MTTRSTPEIYSETHETVSLNIINKPQVRLEWDYRKGREVR